MEHIIIVNFMMLLVKNINGKIIRIFASDYSNIDFGTYTKNDFILKYDL